MTIAIMQPYFLPYIGYFQMINAVDKFIIYDNIEYTKKGWINRNYFLLNRAKHLFSVPLKKDSDFASVNERFLSEEADKSIDKILNQINQSYKKAPLFNEVFPIIENIFLYKNKNLFDYIYNSVVEICNYLEIKTEFVISSTLNTVHSLKSQDKVLSICKFLNADKYINAIGGMELYQKDIFNKENIDLKFIKTNEIKYQQFQNEFIPYLSIIDIMMFNEKERIKEYLKDYKLI